MRLLHRNLDQIICMIIILAWIQVLEAKKSKKQTCPIGFELAYDRYKGDFVCYKRKELETFNEILNDCDGNLYTSKLYSSLNISKLDYSNTLWAEYRSFYPGGPFVSWSQNDGEWSVIDDISAYEPTSLRDDVGQDLCLVINKFGNYTAVLCDEKFYRYCLVRPYSDTDDMTKKGCEDLRGSYRFVNSKEICLLGVTGVGGGTVRATWNQSQAMCGRHGGSLLSRGWQYANMPLFHTSGVSTSPIYPLGMVWDYVSRKLRYVSEDNVVEEPFELFESTLNSTNETVYMAIQDKAWTPVNSSYIFFDVICEHEVQPSNISIKLRINSDNKMILDVNGSVDKDDIHCTTDSESYKPTKVRIHHDDDENLYILSPLRDGYYWCTHIDRYNYRKTESGVVLFIREHSSLINLYTVKIHLSEKYKFSEVNDLKKDWQSKLEEYIFYRTKYVQIVDDYKIANPDEAEKLLREFKSSLQDLSWKSGDVIYKITIKRLYMDKKTVLLHVELNPEMIPVTPGTWGDIEIKFMKPAYYCKGFGSVPRQAIGESTVSKGCRTYTCIGDFNQGVQWVETETPGCSISTAVPMGVGITFYQDVTYRMPTLASVGPISSRQQQYPWDHTETSNDEDGNSDETDLNTGSNSTEEDLDDFTEATPADGTDVTTEIDSVHETEINITDATSTVTNSNDEEDDRRPLPTPSTTVTSTDSVLTTDLTITDPPESTTIDSVLTTDITITAPTTTTTTTTQRPLAPEEQLGQVMHDLEQLLHNDTLSLTVDRVENTFDQINDIFEAGDSLEIPGNLLTMLDELGTRIDLNGSWTGGTVRDNIALLVADATPEHPVRGVRLTAGNQTADTFTNASFEFLDSVNSMQLSANNSAAVVYLPESVTTSERRISFVVFRNERAFRQHDGVNVNSRIVSVNVENVTHFTDGECICCADVQQNFEFEKCECCSELQGRLRKVRSVQYENEDGRIFNEPLKSKRKRPYYVFQKKDTNQTESLQHPNIQLDFQHNETIPSTESVAFYLDYYNQTESFNFDERTESTMMYPVDDFNQIHDFELTTYEDEPTTPESAILDPLDDFNQTDSFELDEPTESTMMYEEYFRPTDSFEHLNISLDFQPNETTAANETEELDTDEDIQEFQEEIIEDLDNLLQNASAIPIESVHETLDKVDSILESDTNMTGELILRLDRLGTKVDLEGFRTLTVVRDNIAVLVADVSVHNPMRGMRITTQRNDTFNNDSFNFITDEDYSSYLSSNASDVVVALPSSLINTSHRISFVVFRDDPFMFSTGSLVNSRVLSATVSNVTHFEKREVLSIYFRPTDAEPGRDWRRACAYWHFLENGTGFWSEEGCTFVKSTTLGILDSCQCDHLTHFAEVLIPVTRFSEQNEIILEILSAVGSCLSVIGLLLVAVTAAVFSSWRKDFSNRIWLQLCVAILILNVCFITTTFAHFDKNIWCVLVGIALHYSVLVSFFWMLVAAIISYRSLVLIFNRDVTRKLLKSSLFAWGTPCVIIGILLAVDYKSYFQKFDDTSPTGTFCYPSGISLWLTTYFPITIILLINWSLFIAILRSLWASKNMRSHGGSKDSLRSAVVSSLLVFMFGLPWIFGLFAYNIVAAYIFTITVSFQGFVLFVFFVLANKRTRNLWIKKLTREQTSITPSTWTESGTSRRQNNANSNLPTSIEMRTLKRKVSQREADLLLKDGRVKVLPPFERPDYYYE